MALLAASCSSDSGDSAAESEQRSEEVVFEPIGVPGEDPFTESTRVQFAAAEPADSEGGTTTTVAGTGLYGGSGDNSLCNIDQFITSLTAQPDKAEAWAEAAGIEVEQLPEYIASLEPVLLASDTRVTNHGFKNGKATAFQSTLQAGTAVLVDSDGIPRARCACGNPLKEPIQVSGEPDPGDSGQAPPVTVPVPPGFQDVAAPPEPAAPAAQSFCDVWAEVDPTISGGPAATGLSIQEYLNTIVAAFVRLEAAAVATDGFPPDALTDIQAYLSDLQAAAASGGGGGDAALRDRVEEFILEYCADEPVTTSTVVEADPDPAPDDAAPGPNCGSFQFFLLVEAAEGLGLDHAAVSELYLDALAAVMAGADPGSEFDVGDLSVALAYEDVGCQGAQAMQQLFADNGMADVIADTPLGP